ncbi:G2/mitotic-specific cyclin-B like protein [Verticillium longisporum]|nr:G2/mitotic-specific cyclin-B like protein [Verticillium longisporum]
MWFSLLNTLYQAHFPFIIVPETLFLAVIHMDRFLTAHVIRAIHMPLVGAAALVMAAKMEERLQLSLHQPATCEGSKSISERQERQ